MSQPTRQAWLLFITLSLIWGSAFLLIKKSLVVFPPTQVAFIRVVAGFVTLAAIAIPAIRQVHKRDWTLVAFSGLLGSLLPAYLFAQAQTQVSSSTAGILSALTPAFTVIINIIFFKGKTSGKNLAGLVLGFTGAAGLMFMKEGGGFEFSNPKALLIVLATMCYAANLNLVKFKLAHIHPMHISSLSLMVVGPLAALGLFATDFGSTINLSDEVMFAFGAAVLLGVTSTGIALLFFNRLLKIASPIFASSITYAMPFMALMLGLADGETLSIGQSISMVVIVLGIYLTR